MAFPRVEAITAVDIGDMATELLDPKPGSGEAQKAIVRVQVIMSNGSVEQRAYNLADHVPAATINQLKALAATLRNMALDNILTG